MKKIYLIFTMIFSFSAICGAQQDFLDERTILVQAIDEVTLRQALGGQESSEQTFKEKLKQAGFVQSEINGENGKLNKAEAKGDLNRDGIQDLVLIVHRLITEDSKKQDDVSQAVLVFLGVSRKPGHYALWGLSSRHFIASTPYFMEKDGIGELSIKKGMLEIGSTVSQSMGSYQAHGCTQKWGFGKAGLQLIELSKFEIDRKCACGTDVDRNFLTGKETIQTNRDKDGNQMEEMKKTEKKNDPTTYFWESFNYDTMCYLEESSPEE